MHPIGNTGSGAISAPSASVPMTMGNSSLVLMNNSTALERVHKCLLALNFADTRERALMELSTMRESVPELAPVLWYSRGSVATLLQEICAIYPYINPPTLSANQSNRVCNALALLQCLASHPKTRSEFLKANIPLYLYTFLTTSNRSQPFEYLRLTSLGVIGALVKTERNEVINFLLSSEIIPLCLKIMESGTELSKTVATFILEKLLLDQFGLAYICQTYERFMHVATILGKMVEQLATEPSIRLLKHVIRCYWRLSDETRAQHALRTVIPKQLTDGTFSKLLESDLTAKCWLKQLLQQVANRNTTQTSVSRPLPFSGPALTSVTTTTAATQPGSSITVPPPQSTTLATTTTSKSAAEVANVAGIQSLSTTGLSTKS